ncbi:MAG: alpha/beta hydrolase [Spirochaeta sp.]|nr:alpha/beta hydrolase [Spirochaeta sp.]RPG03962.1 MAG: alpha/beta hydrolase [Proteobacteria bacterium TMED72]
MYTPRMLRKLRFRKKPDSISPTKPILFVHGAFGGGWDYRPIQRSLEAAGREAYRVTLTGLGERSHLMRPEIDLDTHIMDVLNMMKFEELSDVILVGHSYSGMVISGVAHRAPELIAHLVYVDSNLPEDGETMMSLWPEDERERVLRNAAEEGEGWKVIPWWTDPPRDVAQPLASWTQTVSLGNPEAEKIPGTYVKALGDEEPRESDEILRARVKARGYGYHEWKTTHNPQRSALREYVDLLLSIE